MREFQELIADVLVCEPESLPPDSTPLRNLEGWDSLKHVLLIVSLEQKLDAKLTADEIRAIVTIADVAGILKQKGIDG